MFRHCADYPSIKSILNDKQAHNSPPITTYSTPICVIYKQFYGTGTRMFPKTFQIKTYPMFSFLLKGIIIGLTVAIPVGPVGLMCLDMTVTHGKRAGLSCAYGMVTADIFSAAMMSLGVSLVYTFIAAHSLTIRIFTGLLFACLGLMIFIKRRENRQPPDATKRAGLSVSAFLLSVSPATFALMLFLFPALHLTENNSLLPILTGVALGSASWCALILGAGNFIKSRLGHHLPQFRAIVGCLFMAIGLIAVMSTLTP